MLILSRKLGERLIIADSIVLTVAQIEPGRVRLGIDAPRDICIVREELYQRSRPSQAAGTEVSAAK